MCFSLFFLYKTIMPNTHSSRSRSRSRSHRRERRRDRSRKHSRRSRHRYERTPPRVRSPVTSPPASYVSATPNPVPVESRTLDTILSRLEMIESKFTSTPISQPDQSASSVTQAIVDAFQFVNPGRSHYYVSNFDPSIHDVDSWCDEVDRAQLANRWDDKECLSRVAGCLKGDARTWLNEWVSTDRSWSSFKREFKPLCSRKLDYATILFETMCTTSSKFSSYAEYARRTLLRLHIIKGLPDELVTQIVIRGIEDAQVRAAAANAELSSEKLVSFLSIYVKPEQNKAIFIKTKTDHPSRKRGTEHADQSQRKICFNCKGHGHLSHNCPKRFKPSESTFKARPGAPTCTFCKKIGHTESVCFAKERSTGPQGQHNNRNVNFCQDSTEKQTT